MICRLKLATRPYKNVSTLIPNLQIHPEVQQALHEDKPIVALESTIITHGLPKPDNHRCARSLERIIKSEGAIAATIAVIRGTPYVGLDSEQLEFLASTEDSVKASKRDLTFCVGMGQTAGTTVSGTMALAHAAGIELFATGGIGGVHQGAIEGAQASLDVSADLTELSKIPIMVVCAGVKSILDIPKTLEFLETQAVPVATLSSTEDVDFPGFYFKSSGIKSPRAVFGPANAADFWIAQRDRLQLQSGFLLAVPPDTLNEKDQQKIAEATEAALLEAKSKGIAGKDYTPFLLDRIHKMSEGASLKANVSLVEKNASVAAQIANYLTLKRKRRGRDQQIQNNTTHFSIPTNTNSKNLTDKPTFTILGGSNLDIAITSKKEKFEKFGASNDVEITFTPGGVGRNLAEAFTRCVECKNLKNSNSKKSNPFNIKFISPVGSDLAGDYIQKNLSDLNIQVTPPLAAKSTGTYASLFLPNGSIEIAGADMQISNTFSKNELELCNQTYPGKAVSESLKNSVLFICDLNLPGKLMGQVVDLLPENCVRILDPTSIYKCEKIFGAAGSFGINSFDVITPNFEEYVEIVKSCAILEYGEDGGKDYEIGAFFRDENTLDLAAILYPATRYLDNKIILLTMDRHGVLLIDNFNKKCAHYPVDRNEEWPNSTITNVSGSGDTLTGGFASFLAVQIISQWEGDLIAIRKVDPADFKKSIFSENNLDQAVKFGLEAAQYTLRSGKPVCDRISREVATEPKGWVKYAVQI